MDNGDRRDRQPERRRPKSPCKKNNDNHIDLSSSNRTISSDAPPSDDSPRDILRRTFSSLYGENTHQLYNVPSSELSFSRGALEHRINSRDKFIVDEPSGNDIIEISSTESSPVHEVISSITSAEQQQPNNDQLQQIHNLQQQYGCYSNQQVRSPYQQILSYQLPPQDDHPQLDRQNQSQVLLLTIQQFKQRSENIEIVGRPQQVRSDQPLQISIPVENSAQTITLTAKVLPQSQIGIQQNPQSMPQQSNFIPQAEILQEIEPGSHSFQQFQKPQFAVNSVIQRGQISMQTRAGIQGQLDSDQIFITEQRDPDIQQEINLNPHQSSNPTQLTMNPMSQRDQIFSQTRNRLHRAEHHQSSHTLTTEQSQFPNHTHYSRNSMSEPSTSQEIPWAKIRKPADTRGHNIMTEQHYSYDTSNPQQLNPLNRIQHDCSPMPSTAVVPQIEMQPEFVTRSQIPQAIVSQQLQTSNFLQQTQQLPDSRNPHYMTGPHSSHTSQRSQTPCGIQHGQNLIPPSTKHPMCSQLVTQEQSTVQNFPLPWTEMHAEPNARRGSIHSKQKSNEDHQPFSAQKFQQQPQEPTVAQRATSTEPIFKRPWKITVISNSRGKRETQEVLDLRVPSVRSLHLSIPYKSQTKNYHDSRTPSKQDYPQVGMKRQSKYLKSAKQLPTNIRGTLIQKTNNQPQVIQSLTSPQLLTSTENSSASSTGTRELDRNYVPQRIPENSVRLQSYNWSSLNKIVTHKAQNIDKKVKKRRNEQNALSTEQQTAQESDKDSKQREVHAKTVFPPCIQSQTSSSRQSLPQNSFPSHDSQQPSETSSNDQSKGSGHNLNVTPCFSHNSQGSPSQYNNPSRSSARNPAVSSNISHYLQSSPQIVRTDSVKNYFCDKNKNPSSGQHQIQTTPAATSTPRTVRNINQNDSGNSSSSTKAPFPEQSQEVIMYPSPPRNLFNNITPGTSANSSPSDNDNSGNMVLRRFRIPNGYPRIFQRSQTNYKRDISRTNSRGRARKPRHSAPFHTARAPFDDNETLSVLRRLRAPTPHPNPRCSASGSNGHDNSRNKSDSDDSSTSSQSNLSAQNRIAENR